MSCVDYVRHERLLECNHETETMLAVKLDDGCSGRLCSSCDARLNMRRWPDLAERIAGPANGLDMLEILRALGTKR